MARRENDAVAVLGMPLHAAKLLLDELSAQIPAAKRAIDLATFKHSSGETHTSRKEQKKDTRDDEFEDDEFAERTRTIMQRVNYRDVGQSAVAIRDLIKEALVLSAVDPLAAFDALLAVAKTATGYLPKGRGIHGNTDFFELWTFAPFNDRQCFNMVRELRDAMLRVAAKCEPAAIAERLALDEEDSHKRDDHELDGAALIKDCVEEALSHLHGDDGFADSSEGERSSEGEGSSVSEGSGYLSPGSSVELESEGEGEGDEDSDGGGGAEEGEELEVEVDATRLAQVEKFLGAAHAKGREEIPLGQLQRKLRVRVRLCRSIRTAELEVILKALELKNRIMYREKVVHMI